MRGRRAATSDDARRRAVNDLLLPIVKGVGSERSWVLLGTESLQTFGGSGFLQDYPLEQYVRDAKIDTLYEGTTAIQGLDFFFRKIVRDQGQALGHLAEQIAEFAKADAGGNGRLAAERELLAQGAGGRPGHRRAHGRRADGLPTRSRRRRRPQPLQGRAEHHPAADGRRRPRRRLAAAAPGRGRAAPAGRRGRHGRAERAFYEGKVAAARFFAATRLPLLTAERAIAEATDNTLMDLDEAAF